MSWISHAQRCMPAVVSVISGVIPAVHVSQGYKTIQYYSTLVSSLCIYHVEPTSHVPNPLGRFVTGNPWKHRKPSRSSPSLTVTRNRVTRNRDYVLYN